MDTSLKVFVLAAVVVSGLSMAPAFGQITVPIVVMTDKTSYAEGETIMVTGEVRDRLSGQPVSLVVTAPNDNRVAINQLAIDSENKFSTEITVGGPLMKVEGEYTITVTYGSQARTAETTFMLTDVTETKDEPKPTTSSLMLEGADEAISYTITGGTITSIVPNVDDTSLLITIDATDNGSLDITLPKSIIDGINIILVDGEQQFETDRTDSDNATRLVIEFTAGTEEIELFGTFVIPEFGTIALLVLAAAIISIVAVTSRSKIGIMPRY